VTPYLSQKLKNISFILMIMVVFLHSYNIDIKQSGQILYFQKNWNWIIQNFISNGLTRIAVPLFFLISGYLFVFKSDLTRTDFAQKIKKRIQTLLVPYLFWAFFGLFVYYVLQSFPQSQPFFTKKLIKEYDFSEWVNAVFYEPIPYQLWFLRDLIIMSFLSPLICFFIKKLNWKYLSVVFIFWFLNLDSVVLTSEALLFFSIGIFISINYPKIAEIRKSTFVGMAFWFLLLSLKTVADFYNYEKTGLYLLKVSILVGLIGFWNFYDIASNNNTIMKLLKKYGWTSFFIYVFHEPAMTIIKKGVFYCLSKTQVAYVFVYVSAPIITIILSVLIAIILKKKWRAVYQLITGGRG
jgi:surface polysaccharide O-acyltransferase-like enzyme